ncbi:permease [Desulfitobacterium metallireducens]|uniref:Membrane protein n=1 Tax=Desulfitobacterium metallireducens DSM 15288 TaxID=871968 RepID=W0E5G3_9FIRM|nr:permease [Desulfitobacterium metallireducens]AHF05997.1 membrane protein [Desulfitobacterium metallireducens DSM 15288]
MSHENSIQSIKENLVNSSRARKDLNRRKVIFGALFFLLVAIIGLFYIKWNPYYAKAFLAANKHSIGESIITGKAAVAPSPSWGAAVEYTTSYFRSVWKAVILGLLLGSLVQVLIPRTWVNRFFGQENFKSTALAGMAAIPSMMCTCCAAPVAVGLRKRSASAGSTMAYWLGNPVLNPATIIFMGFVLSWKFALIRIIAGLILVLGVSYWTNKMVNEKELSNISPLDLGGSEEIDAENFFVRWIKSLWPLVLDTIPAYLVAVFVLGAVRAWLFPVISPEWGNSLLVIIGLAITGTLFIIPTAAEIPIVQTLMSFGLGVGPGVALMMTLPAVSIPSLVIVKRVFPLKVLTLVTGSVMVVGIISGLLAGLMM